MASQWRIIAALLLCVTGSSLAAGDGIRITMQDKGAATYYVSVTIAGWGADDYLVDTGSTFMTISEPMLVSLEEKGQANYLRELSGTLADGSRVTVPVYRLTEVRIGQECVLKDVEAAVFPQGTRRILGLSALARTAPFSFSVNPPELHLSQCFDLSKTAKAEG